MEKTTKFIEINNSTLLKRVIYNYDSEEMVVFFVNDKYYTDNITYIGVPSILFEEMELNRLNSYGKFYLQQIKPNFKTKKKQFMSENNMPKGVNNASDKQRIISLRINLSKVNKEWLFKGKEGDIYLDATMLMKPDGEVDKYENLGMVIQKVPTDVYKKDKTIKGEILGNARENQWLGSSSPEAVPGAPLEAAGSDVVDDLPF